MNKQVISFYKLCQELSEEVGLPEIKFQNFYRQKKKEFKKILLSLGVDDNSIRKVDLKSFEIPEVHKETIRKLLKTYTSVPMKKIRNGEFTSMDFKDLKEIVEPLDKLLQDTLMNELQLQERTKLFAKTRFIPLQALSNVRTSALEQVLKITKEMENDFIKDESFLNDTDKAHLIRYFGQLLQHVTHQWHDIVTIYSNLRFEEISEIQGEIEVEQLDEPYLVIWKAIQIQRDNSTFLDNYTELKKSTKEELKVVEEFIKEYNRNKD